MLSRASPRSASATSSCAIVSGAPSPGGLSEGRRLLDAIGWPAVLAVMLATLGVVFVDSSCARLEDRRWDCWGDNFNGVIAGHNEPPLMTPTPLKA